jgi:hypothetical protein
MIKGREVKQKQVLSKDMILERVSQEALFKFYLKLNPNSSENK